MTPLPSDIKTAPRRPAGYGGPPSLAPKKESILNSIIGPPKDQVTLSSESGMGEVNEIITRNRLLRSLRLRAEGKKVEPMVFGDRPTERAEMRYKNRGAAHLYKGESLGPILKLAADPGPSNFDPLEFAAKNVDSIAGFGDSMGFGLPRGVRHLMGTGGFVNTKSRSYNNGENAALFVGLGRAAYTGVVKGIPHLARRVFPKDITKAAKFASGTRNATKVAFRGYVFQLSRSLIPAEADHQFQPKPIMNS